MPPPQARERFPCRRGLDEYKSPRCDSADRQNDESACGPRWSELPAAKLALLGRYATARFRVTWRCHTL